LTLLGGTAALRYAAVHNAAGAFASATYFAGAALMAGAAFGLWTFKPWRSSRGGKILERDWVRLVVAALCLAAGTFVSLYCLRVIGSLRAFLLDYVDIAAVVAGGAPLAPPPQTLPPRAPVRVAGGVALLFLSPPTAAPPPSVALSGGGRARAPRAPPLMVPLVLPRRLLQAPMAWSEDGSDNGERQAQVAEDPFAAAAAAAAAGAGDVASEGGGGGGDENDVLVEDVAQGGAAGGVSETNSEPGLAGSVDGGDGGGGGDGASDGEAAAEYVGGEGEDAPPAAAETATARASRRRAAYAAAARVKTALDAHTMGSVVLAGVFVVAASWLQTARRRLTRAVADDTGLGLPRTHALVVTLAAAAWLPAVMLRWAIVAPDGVPAANAPAPPGMLVFLVAALLFGVIVIVLSETALESHSALGSLTSPMVPVDAAGSVARKPTAVSDATFIRLIVLSVGACLGVAYCVSSSEPTARSQVTAALAVATFVLYIPGLAAVAGLGAPPPPAPPARRVGGSRHAPAPPPARGGGSLRAASDLALAAAAAGLSTLLTWVDALGGASGAGGGGGGMLEFGGGSTGTLVHSHKDVLARGRSTDRAGGGGGSGGGTMGLWRLTVRVMNHVWEDRNSRKLFLFLTINVRARGGGVGG